MAVSNNNIPTLTIDSNVWDMTWILNKTARLVEKYEVPITVSIEKSNSVEVQIILGMVGGAAGSAFIGEVAKLFAHDIYFYIKDRIYKQRFGKKPPKRKPMPKKTDTSISREVELRQNVQKPKKEIEIRWNNSWEKEGLPTGEEDER